MIKNPKIGADPELFLTRNGEIVPATGLIQGTKSNPYNLGDGFGMQLDNVMVEYNIPPATTKNQFRNNIICGMQFVKQTLGTEYNLEISPSHIFNDYHLLDPSAHIFGCEPDYDAWTGKRNMFFLDPEHTGLRVCGGHLHIGYDQPTLELNRALIKACDMFLGVPSILMDSDKLRRKMYGKAGSFRHKSYGPEYRTLSSFWLKRESLIDWVYDQVHFAIDFVNKGGKISKYVEEKIIHTINTSDETTALELCDELDLKIVI